MCVCLNYMVFSVSAATVFKEPVCILQRSFPIFCGGKFDSKNRSVYYSVRFPFFVEENLTSTDFSAILLVLNFTICLPPLKRSARSSSGMYAIFSRYRADPDQRWRTSRPDTEPMPKRPRHAARSTQHTPPPAPASPGSGQCSNLQTIYQILQTFASFFHDFTEKSITFTPN